MREYAIHRSTIHLFIFELGYAVLWISLVKISDIISFIIYPQISYYDSFLMLLIFIAYRGFMFS